MSTFDPLLCFNFFFFKHAACACAHCTHTPYEKNIFLYLRSTLESIISKGKSLYRTEALNHQIGAPLKNVTSRGGFDA
ncbi:hypothetical protein AMTRI_Chr09g16760 [Amborella trichopoda]